MRLQLCGFVALVCLVGVPAPARALAIIGNFQSFAVGPDDDPAQGGGNIVDIFAAAARTWEAAILDDLTVQIQFGWVPGAPVIGDGPLAFSLGNHRDGEIFVSVSHDWFLDATPATAEEYATAERRLVSFGDAAYTYGLGFSGGIGAADGTDLYTVLLHEIGHVLSFGPSAFADYADGDVDVTAPRPRAGLELPVADNCCHLQDPSGFAEFNPLMFKFIGSGERRLISDADLLFVAETGDWTQLDSRRFAVPEPAATGLILLALGTWLRRRSTAR
jgi:hypothetical protein